MSIFFIVIVIGLLALAYAHWKLHLSMAQIKADILAEIAKLTGKGNPPKS